MTDIRGEGEHGHAAQVFRIIQLTCAAVHRDEDLHQAGIAFLLVIETTTRTSNTLALVRATDRAARRAMDLTDRQEIETTTGIILQLLQIVEMTEEGKR